MGVGIKVITHQHIIEDELVGGWPTDVSNQIYDKENGYM